MKTKLYDHQERAKRQAVEALRAEGYHALLMEMGTGKTLTTLAIFEEMARHGDIQRMVVVAPKSLLSTWEAEIEKHLGNIRVYRYSATKWKTEKARKAFSAWLLEPVGIALVNIEAYSVGVPEIATHIGGSILIIDESSKIKNPAAIRTKNLCRTGKVFAHRLILTGTEITNSPLDVFGQFEFLKPGIFGFRSFFMFKSYYAVMVEKYGSGGRTFKDIVGYRHVDELEAIVNAHSFRALKKDCLDLPEKVVSPIYVEASAVQKRMIAELKAQCMTMVNDGVLTALNRATLFGKFRQIVGGAVIIDGVASVLDDNPKLDALLDDVEDTDAQAIIWAAHVAEVELIAQALEKVGTVAMFYGGMAQDKREDSVRAFQAGAARFFVGTPQCGAYGLNLQGCSLMYYYSRPTSPTDNWQSADRIHRSGQVNVCVYKPIIMRGTVDTRIEQLLAEKTDVLSAFQSGTLAEFLANIGEE